MIDKPPLPDGFRWVIRRDRLAIAMDEPNAMRPLGVDWSSADMLRRIRAGRRQALARAVGLKSAGLKVLDAMAGLGRDAATLAALGCEVTLAERSPILQALLSEAMDEAGEAGSRMRLHAGDSRDLDPAAYDVIYLDPMFPASSKGAKPAREMQYLRALLGPDEDFLDDWNTHWSQLPVRRVLKRPPHGARVQLGRPDFSTGGGRVVYSVYLPTGRKCSA